MHPRNIERQAEEHGQRAEDLFRQLFHHLLISSVPTDQATMLTLINSTVKMAFLNGWDAAIGNLEDRDDE